MAVALIDSTISREKIEIPAHSIVSVTALGETFGSEDKSGKLDELSHSISIGVSLIENWHRKITRTPCPRDPKRSSLQLGKRQWEEDGSCGQRGCVHYVWLRPSRQRDTWRDPGFPLDGMRARLLSMWFHWWYRLHDCLPEGKPPVPCWTGLNFLGVSLSLQRKGADLEFQAMPLRQGKRRSREE